MKISKSIIIIGVGIAAFLFLILLGTSIIFFYLYVNKTTECPTLESCEKVEEITPVEEVETCDIEKIILESQERYNRVDTTYSTILNDTANVYPRCKEVLKDRISKLLQGQEGFEGFYDLEYLIDDTFIISVYSNIWSVDIKTGEVKKMWEIKNPGFLQILNMHTFYYDDRAEYIFQVLPTGMGGTAAEEESLNKEIERMCTLNVHGLWKYDTGTDKFTRFSTAGFAECTRE